LRAFKLSFEHDNLAFFISIFFTFNSFSGLEILSNFLAYLKRALSLFFLISSKILETDNLTSSEPTLFDLIFFLKLR